MSNTIQHFPLLRTLTSYAGGEDFFKDPCEKVFRVTFSLLASPLALTGDLALTVPIALYNNTCALCTKNEETSEILEVAEDMLTAKPISNSAHLRKSVDAALALWTGKQAAAFREDLVDGMVDKWNVFQVAAEWSIAQYLESSLSNQFVPDYLANRPALADGTTVESLASAFRSLSPSDRNELLKTIRLQSETSRFEVQSLIRQIRALASELHQGNRPLLEAIQGYEYAAPAEPNLPAERPATLSDSESSDLVLSPPPRPALRPSAPPQRYVPVSDSTDLLLSPPPRTVPRPSAPRLEDLPRYDIPAPRYPVLPRYPVHRPSAPPAPVQARESADVKLSHDIALVRNALKQAMRSQGTKTEALHRLATRPLSLQDKQALATLTLAYFLQQTYVSGNRYNRKPDFIQLDQSLYNARSLRQIGQEIAHLPNAQCQRLLEECALPISLAPRRQVETSPLHLEIERHGRGLAQSRDFGKVLEALKIDLLAD